MIRNSTRIFKYSNNIKINCNKFLVLSITKNGLIKSYTTTTSTKSSNINTNTNININNNNNNNNNNIDDFVSPQSKDKIQELLRLFPPIKYGFAYGSGVIKQKGYNDNEKKDNLKKSEPMIDLIFAVENSSKWHEINLQSNGSHYSFLKYFGGGANIARYQRNGAKIYYNTLLEHNGIKFKYGVIEYKDLIDDLKNWKTLYVSGRMQKPIYNLPLPPTNNNSNNGNEEINKINEETNLRNAVISSILQLPETFTEYELYHKICSISYRGDVRWWFGSGENPNKIHNIIINNIDGFRKLYFPVIEKYLADYLEILKNEDNNDNNNNNNNNNENNENNNQNKFIQLKSNINSSNQINLIMMLPKSVNLYLLKMVRKNMIEKKTDQLIPTYILDESLQTIVRYSSFVQTLRGILTAGIFKSLNYIKLKLVSSKKK